MNLAATDDRPSISITPEEKQPGVFRIDKGNLVAYVSAHYFWWRCGALSLSNPRWDINAILTEAARECFQVLTASARPRVHPYEDGS